MIVSVGAICGSPGRRRKAASGLIGGASIVIDELLSRDRIGRWIHQKSRKVAQI
jgi:hypothetical protein